MTRGRFWQLFAPVLFVLAVIVKFSAVAVIWAAIMSVWLSVTTWNKFCKWIDND